MGGAFVLGAGSVITCVSDSTPTDGGTTDATTNDAGSDASDPCASRVADTSKGVFVDINGTDSSQCGGPSAPCKTVQAGVNQAKVLSKSIVYVGRGTYVESVTLSAGITVEGGWDTLGGKWIPACGADQIAAVKLQMPDSAHVTVTADFTGATTLRNLTLLGKTASATPGESVYGVFAHNASVTFESSAIGVGAAGTGGDGDAGATGNAGGTKCATSTGADGGTGTTGTGADAGTFGATGYVPTSGSSGLGNGASGNNGTCTANCSGNEVTHCTPNTTNCSASQGCTGVLAGCGGAPGTAGAGGNGGGSSFAVYGWDATFTLTGGSFVGGSGGNGGAGGQGGAGGGGGSGTTEQELCVSCVSGNNCATVGNQTIATGGKGGNGGQGGAGGGGAGGFSYGIYAGGPNGKITVQSAPLFQHGAAGTGGPPNGAAGASGDRFPP